LVYQYATSLGISVALFDVYPHDLDSGNFQDAARNERHRIFREEMNRIGAQGIALGHNQLDRLETLLMRIMRGSAPSHWDGIVEHNAPLVRPLLSSTREDIVAWAQQHNVPWREDESNLSSKYARNLLRNELIPSMDALLPGWKHNIERIADYGSIYVQALDVIIGEDLKSKQLSISKLTTHPELLQKALIHRFLESHDVAVSHSIISELLQLMGSQSGKFIELNEETAVYKEGTFLVIDSHSKAESFSLIVPEISRINQSIVTPIGTLGIHELGDLPSTEIEFRNPGTSFNLRTWAAGDRIQLGHIGTKNISDLITDWKIPLRLKSSVYVLALDATIIACIFAHPDYPTRHRIAPEWMAHSARLDSSCISFYLNH